MHTVKEGIILKGVGGFYDVLDTTDGAVYTCKARGVHRKTGGKTPLPGDNVTFRVIDERDLTGYIDEILERKNEFVRPPVANIDQLAIVLAAKSPEPDLSLADKLLITCEAKGISPLILINKIDLDDDGTAGYISGVYRKAGYRVIFISKVLDAGYDELHEELRGKRTAFAGQSGVGKSTILNRILNNWVMETGEVSERIQRGKHTTRHVQLFKLDVGGFVLDTPGFSAYSVCDIEHTRLALLYPEFRKVIGECRFTSCSHTAEPGCRVRELVEKGEADTGRYERYVQYYKELKEAYDNRYRR
jgi:ribosome small subunit-dependent GTPase A